jgi:pentatricopeptide repeat protein
VTPLPTSRASRTSGRWRLLAQPTLTLGYAFRERLLAQFAEALARAGRVDEARLAFEKMLTYANRLGLTRRRSG